MSFTPTPDRRGARGAGEIVRLPDDETQRTLRMCGMDDETVRLSREAEANEELDRLNSHGPASAMRWAA